MINPEKVLLIVNSDVALSTQAADYYVAARGLNAAHRLSFAFGTGLNSSILSANVFTSLITPVADYMVANSIEAVFCSAGVPQNQEKPDGAGVLNVSLANLLGHAKYYKNAGTADGSFTYWPKYTTNASVSYGQPMYIRPRTSYLWKGNPDWVPFGRIGLPKFDAAVPDETLVLTQRIIDDALANEHSYKSAANLPVHFGLHDRTNNINALSFEFARQCMVAANVPTRHYRLTYNAAWTIQPPADSYSRATMIAGTLNPTERAWGMVGSAIMNEVVGAAYINSYEILPGAWGYEATSYGSFLAANAILAGGCAFCGTALEPYDVGVIKPYEFVEHLLNGFSMAEAMTFCGAVGGGQMDCWGDPLYRPFGKQTVYFVES